ncbi:MAG: dTDP-glucose 4,6-dehydratase [Candidatus Diapherotrites archaeon]
MRVLVTGGAGFIGSNFVRYMLQKYPKYEIVNLDKLTYAGRTENLSDVEDDEKYTFIKGDICNSVDVEKAMKGCDLVVNFAAESHVDRSIEDASAFVRTNFEGVRVMLESAMKQNVKKFIQIGTDEVYGSVEKGSSTENDLIKPKNPYSAAKAAADLLALSYFNTYELPVVVTRSSNNYGPYQFPEKLIPRFVTNLIQGKKVPIYGDGLNVRDWLYVLDNCEAIDVCLHKGKNGEIYNIGGGNEVSNLEITKRILSELGKGKEMIEHVKDRKGHDRRYSLDSGKIKKKLGWTPKKNFEKGIKETVKWYAENETWWTLLVK